MQVAERLAGADPLIAATRHLVLDLADPGADAAATAWWEELTGAGGEGMVVKPADPVTRGRHGIAQPGIKCRGPEYLRIIYGPEYTLAGNLDRLRERSLGRKRSLATAEFALGVEALERFVRREPAFRVHECVFGVLALEFADAADHDRVQQGDVLVLAGIREALVAGTEIAVRNETRDEVYAVRNGLSTRQVDMLLVGGLIPWLRERRARDAGDLKEVR